MYIQHPFFNKPEWHQVLVMVAAAWMLKSPPKPFLHEPQWSSLGMLSSIRPSFIALD